MHTQSIQALLLDLSRQAQIRQNTFFQELSPDELEIIGEPDCWSAKDHVAHLTFWRQRLTLRLQAHIRREPQPEIEHFEQLNPSIFEENRYRTWSEILAESDQAYTDLIAITQQLSDEDLTATDRFAWLDGSPLYLSFMGNCYEHTQIHLGDYLLNRHDLARATAIHEEWASTILGAEIPDRLKGHILYNLACFYALHEQLEKAATNLERALELAPDLKEWSLTDTDLDALRATQAGQLSENADIEHAQNEEKVMVKQSGSLAPFYQGWESYQQHLVHALAPLSVEQLALRAAPRLRSIGVIARHIIGARARWMHGLLEDGGEELVALGEWDDEDQPERPGTELAHGLEQTWQVIQDSLQRWTSADLEKTFTDTGENGEEETFTRQWVIWHLIEHDLHHGGEISFSLGMHDLPAIDL